MKTKKELCECCQLPVCECFGVSEPPKKPQHTPTPWKIDAGNVGNDDIIYRNPSDDNNGMGFSIKSGISDGKRCSTEQDFIDMEFIVRAVNSHEALLDTLRIVARGACLNQINVTGDCICYPCISQRAIAKADEKPC